MCVMGNAAGVRARFYRAIEDGRIDIVKQMLDLGLDIREDHHALEKAARRGHARIVELLLRNGINTSTRTCDALDVSIVKRHDDVVTVLMTNNFPLGGRNKYGETIAHVAACANYGPVIDMLAERQVDLNDPTRGWCPIHVAVQRHGTEVLMALLRNGAQLDCRNINQNTPLEIAISLAYDRTDEVALLVAAGCKIDFQTLLTENYVQNRLEGNCKLRGLLTESIHKPKTLVTLCCIHIRKSLGCGLLQKVSLLSLPKSLEDCICMHTLFGYQFRSFQNFAENIDDIVLDVHSPDETKYDY